MGARPRAARAGGESGSRMREGVERPTGVVERIAGGGVGLEKKVLVVLREAEVNELRMIAQDRDEAAAYAYLKNVLLKKVEEALRKACR